MFKKSYTAQGQNLLSKKDLKALKSQLLELYPSLTEKDLDEILPEGQAKVVKLDNRSLLYSAGDAPPVFFDAEGRSELKGKGMEAKAKAKAGLRRPAGAGPRMRRPAFAPPAVAAAPILKKLHELDLVKLRDLEFIVLEDAKYYGRTVKLCGRVVGVRMEGRQVFVELRVTGTQDDGLLRSLTGRPSRKIDVHACEPGCPQVLENERLVHGGQFREEDQAKEEWYSNIENVVPEADGPDELARMREAALEMKAPKKEKKRKKDEEEGREAPRKEKKKRDASSEEEDEDRGKKTQEALFENTGLDPDVKRRFKYLRKARRLGRSKKKKKKKRSSGSGSSSSSSSGSSAASTGRGGTLFSSEKRIKSLWKRYPGALTAQSLKETQERLISSSGMVWGADQKAVAPVFVHYARQDLMGHMSAPMSQETLTITMALDLLIQGRVAATMDLLSQRVKALETLSRGGHWSVARQLELCRVDDGGIAGEAEALKAAKEAREEEKVKDLVARPNPRGGDKGYGQKGKKGKEAKGTSKGKPEDGGKGRGEGRKDDNSQGWQNKKK
eukprot:Skav218165  [mRNA]  locus=scaffold5213:66233:75512:- [translate_table: standard]